MPTTTTAQDFGISLANAAIAAGIYSPNMREVWQQLDEHGVQLEGPAALVDATEVDEAYRTRLAKHCEYMRDFERREQWHYETYGKRCSAYQHEWAAARWDERLQLFV